VTAADLHVIGSAHEARFGESFDAELAAAIESAYDPARAAGELDELGLLGVLPPLRRRRSPRSGPAISP